MIYLAEKHRIFLEIVVYIN